MTKSGSSARRLIKRLLGLTDKQADALMPGDDNNAAGFPVAIYLPGQNIDDGEWARREYEKDMQRHGDRPTL